MLTYKDVFDIDFCIMLIPCFDINYNILSTKGFQQLRMHPNSLSNEKKKRDWMRRVDSELRLFGYNLRDWRPDKKSSLLWEWELIR